MSTGKQVVYLDNNATTPMDGRILEVMMPYMKEMFGNPHSRNHSLGWEAEEAVENARQQIATLIGANSKDIIFTSGATESNNLALKGVMEFYAQQGKKHLIVSCVEHKCILASAHYLESKGYEVTYLSVNDKGIINLNELRDAIKPNTALVSIMSANNEIGVIQPIKAIGALCREKGVFFHTDAAQSIGKVHIDVDDMNIDLMSISSHKFYGPKGVGVLYVRRKPRVRVSPQIHGGGQERGLRSGTIPTHLCVGMGEAAAIALREMDQEVARITKLRDDLKGQLRHSLSRIYLNGDEEQRLCNNLNISFAGVEGESLLLGINEDIAVSSGSACTSSSLESSYVLKALGVEEELAHTSIRFGLGRFTTKEEIDYVAQKVISTVQKLRAMSPLWDMLEAGIDLKTIEWSGH